MNKNNIIVFINEIKTSKNVSVRTQGNKLSI